MYFVCEGVPNSLNIYSIISFEEIKTLPPKVAWYKDLMLRIAPNHFEFSEDGMIIKPIPIYFNEFYISDKRLVNEQLTDFNTIDGIWFINEKKFIIEFPYYRDFIGAKLYVC